MDPATGSRAVAHLRDHVLHKLRELYGAVAATNYQAVAKQFDDAATRFTEVASTVDVEADAASMIDKPDRQRKAYLDAESFAKPVDEARRAAVGGHDISPRCRCSPQRRFSRAAVGR
jgi:hypothetical protein